MRKTVKMAVSLLLSLTLLITTLTSGLTAQAASPFSDLSTSHWAYNVINGMYTLGFIKGNTKGQVKPDAYVTTAEFMAILNRMFGLKIEGRTKITDISGHWSETEKVFSYADAQGYLILEEGNQVHPDAKLTREKAFALIARYLGRSSTAIVKFADSTSIDSDYVRYINALVEDGIINGYPSDNTLRPGNYLKRSEAMKLLFYMIGGNVIHANTANVQKQSFSDSTIVAAITAGVTLSNSNLDGTVYISEGATNETVTISKCNIQTLVIRASNCVVKLVDTAIEKLDINSSSSGNVTVIASGSTIVTETDTKVTTKLEDQTADGGAFALIYALTASRLTLSGKSFPQVQLAAASAKLAMANAQTVIKSLVINAASTNATVTGYGIIQSADILAGGVQISVLPERYTIATGLTARFNGKSYSSHTDSDINAETGFAVTPYIASMNNDTARIIVNVETAGHLYAAVVRKSYMPSADTIIKLCRNYPSEKQSFIYKTAFIAVNEANKDKLFEIGIPTENLSDYKLVCVLESTDYKPVSLELTTSAKAIAYTAEIPQVTMRYRPETTDGCILNTNDVVLSWNAKLFSCVDSEESVTETPLTQDNVKSFFKLYHQYEDHSWSSISADIYDVTLETYKDGETVIVFTPKSDRVWPKGTNRIEIDSSLMNASWNRTNDVYGETAALTFVTANSVAVPVLTICNNEEYLLRDDKLYLEAGLSKAMVQLTVRSNSDTEIYYSYNRADYEASEPKGNRYTEPFALNMTQKTLYYWSVCGTEKSPLSLADICTVEEPVLKTEKGFWMVDTAVSATWTRTDCDLVLTASLDGKALPVISVISDQRLYLKTDGTALTTEKPEALDGNLAGQMLTLQLLAQIDGQTVASGTSYTVMIGYTQGVAGLPIIEAENLSEKGEWKADSSLKIRVNAILPSEDNVRLWVWTRSDMSDMQVIDGVSASFYLLGTGELVSQKPAVFPDFTLKSPENNVVVHVAWLKEEAGSYTTYYGLESTYTIGENGFLTSYVSK